MGFKFEQPLPIPRGGGLGYDQRICVNKLRIKEDQNRVQAQVPAFATSYRSGTKTQRASQLKTLIDSKAGDGVLRVNGIKLP
jgi:hypothetical protein